MSVQDIDIRRTVKSDPAGVWELLAASSSWPNWTPISSYEQVRAANPDGTGEIRLFRNGRHTVREEIVERRPQQRLSYILLDGLPLRDYRADIDLSARPDGWTDLRWHTTFTAKTFGSGWLYRLALHRATSGFVDGLAQAAER